MDDPRTFTTLPGSQPWFPPEEIECVIADIRAALERGVLTRGPHVAAFEREFAAAVGTRHAAAVASGTAALEIILRYFLGEPRRGEPPAEVIVPTNTFLATANAVIFAGGRPVLTDIEPAGLGLSIEAVEAALSPRTRGVIAVHIAGRVCPAMDAFRELCRARGLFLIEDAAHAHGAAHRGRPAGGLADAAAFSFFPTKPMTTGEGGMIATDDKALDAFARAYRNHGVGTQPGDKPFHVSLGHNLRMSELGAILGRSQLRSLEPSLDRRRAVAAVYREGLARLSPVQLPSLPADGRHAWYKFPVFLLTAELRAALATALFMNHGIQTGSVYWPPCHLQPVVAGRPDLYGVAGPMPVAESLLPRVLCLPIHARMTVDDAARVVEAVAVECDRVRLAASDAPSSLDP